MPQKGRRSFQDDFEQALRSLVADGTIEGFSSDLGGLGSVFNIHVRVSVPGPASPVEVALVRDRVRQAVAHLTDNVMISVERDRPRGRLTVEVNARNEAGQSRRG